MAREVLLIEPNYKNKYPPMGLMKISTYYKRLGDHVRFFKGDLLDLVSELLCDRLMIVLNGAVEGVNWKKYTLALRRFIRYGKLEELPSDSCFTDAVIEHLKSYRQKFRNKEYFQLKPFDVVGVTTLFTFHWGVTIDTINFAKKFCKDDGTVFVGGVAATIVPSYMEEETGIKPSTGLLDKPGALGDDNDIIIDTLPLDYSILREIDYVYPAEDAYFAYMTRGCVNKCSFCAVPILEPEYKPYLPLREDIETIRTRFGEQRDLLLLDNNVLASSCFNTIIDEIAACGFEKDATYVPQNQYDVAIRNLRDGTNDRAYIRLCVKFLHELIEKCNKPHICRNLEVSKDLYKRVIDADCYDEYTATKDALLQLNDFVQPLFAKYAYRPSKRQRYIDFNQGVDARLITPEKMQKLAEVNIRPLRIAFDHWGLKDTYEKAVRAAAAAGIKHLSNYMLYNFNEKPADLFRRMQLTVNLSEELDITIYSFPMKYHPISDPNYFRNREYIGEHWCRKYIRAVQAVLTSTHGKIGRGKQFFETAFGRNEAEFEGILLMPEALIIRRFENDASLRARHPLYSKAEYHGSLTDEWRQKYNALSDEQKTVAFDVIKYNKFTDSDIDVADEAIRSVLQCYQISREHIGK
jgi:hypothetical protein